MPYHEEKTVCEIIVLKMLNASKEDVLNNFRILRLLQSEQEGLYCEAEMKTKICRDYMDGFREKCVNTSVKLKEHYLRPWLRFSILDNRYHNYTLYLLRVIFKKSPSHFRLPNFETQ
ncbi:hypothetical protein DMUE_4191 [Dictyocoela muelleri]|nr:hypothetical protein DMUE_4191 [Dictyocoela muelleri]